jgi:hypothetical protein
MNKKLKLKIIDKDKSDLILDCSMKMTTSEASSIISETSDSIISKRLPKILSKKNYFFENKILKLEGQGNSIANSNFNSTNNGNFNYTNNNNVINHSINIGDKITIKPFLNNNNSHKNIRKVIFSKLNSGYNYIYSTEKYKTLPYQHSQDKIIIKNKDHHNNPSKNSTFNTINTSSTKINSMIKSTNNSSDKLQLQLKYSISSTKLKITNKNLDCRNSFKIHRQKITFQPPKVIDDIPGNANNETIPKKKIKRPPLIPQPLFYNTPSKETIDKLIPSQYTSIQEPNYIYPFSTINVNTPTKHKEISFNKPLRKSINDCIKAKILIDKIELVSKK